MLPRGVKEDMGLFLGILVVRFYERGLESRVVYRQIEQRRWYSAHGARAQRVRGKRQAARGTGEEDAGRSQNEAGCRIRILESPHTPS